MLGFLILGHLKCSNRVGIRPLKCSNRAKGSIWHYVSPNAVTTINTVMYLSLSFFLPCWDKNVGGQILGEVKKWEVKINVGPTFWWVNNLF